MKNHIPVLTALFLVSLTVVLPLRSPAANIFPVADGNWDSDIWDDGSTGPVTPGLRPGTADTVVLSSNGRSVTVNSDVGSVSIVRFNNTSGSTNLSLQTGAVLSIDSMLDIGRVTSGTGAANVTVQNGALLNIGASGIRIGNPATGGTTTARLTINGTVVSAGLVVIAQQAAGSTSTGILTLQGGSLTATALQKGTGTATFDWAGGALSVATTNLATMANTGTGNLAVGGAGTVGTFGLQTGTTTAYTQGADASMSLDFASDASFDTIGIGLGTALNMSLDGTISLNLLAGYTPTMGATFDVITATSIANNTFVLGGNGASYFTYEIVDLGANDVLRLTAVPEPSACALIAAVGVMGVLFRRRR